MSDDPRASELAPPTDMATFFEADLRVGTIRDVAAFPEARKPAWKLWVDFGPDIGTRASSAQITELYGPEDLIGLQVVALVNVPARRVGPFTSECLVTGFHGPDGVVLTTVERTVPNGTRLT